MTDIMKTEQRREAFKKWCIEFVKDKRRLPTDFDCWCAALDSQAAQAQPSGWKLVPIEPTEEMIAAFCNCQDWDPADGTEAEAYFTYKAMIAASPSHSKEPGDGGGAEGGGNAQG